MPNFRIIRNIVSPKSGLPPLFRLIEVLLYIVSDAESGCGRPTSGGPPAWWLGEVLTTPHCKNVRYYETFHKASDVDWLFDSE
jgi:hypothetical protein